MPVGPRLEHRRPPFRIDHHPNAASNWRRSSNELIAKLARACGSVAEIQRVVVLVVEPATPWEAKATVVNEHGGKRTSSTP